MISHLSRRGYVKETGMFRRFVKLTDKGSSILQKYVSMGGVL
jgi:predicted transcriptional regulator